MVVVTIDLFPQHCADVFQGGETLDGTGADDPVLEPSIRSFHLAFGLWGQSEDDLDPEKAHHLAPLGVDVVRLEHMFAPDTVPALDEAEDA